MASVDGGGICTLHDCMMLEQIGDGLCSTVWRVRREGCGDQELAAKVVRGDEHSQSHTHKEIAILKRCAHHPNIVKLHDVMYTETATVLFMELCKRDTLHAHRMDNGPLSVAKTRDFMRQLFKAVSFLHEQNIVHRDLKVIGKHLLDDNWGIKVSDFGFAEVIEKDGELREISGNLHVHGPEMLKTHYEGSGGYGQRSGFMGVWRHHVLSLKLTQLIRAGRYTFAAPEWTQVTDTAKHLISRLLVVDPKVRLTAEEALSHPFFIED